jgi:small conductance mechanosensitive channel
MAQNVMLAATNPQWWQSLLDQAKVWLLDSGVRIAVILVLLLICLRVTRAAVRRAVLLAVRPNGRDTLRDLMAAKRQVTLISLFDAIVSISLVAVAVLMILPRLGFEIGPLLASAGVAGVALGFGAQSLVKDVLSGTFIILEQQFSVGDVVRVGTLSGAVEQINLRTTVLRDADGSVHVIPNGQIDKVTVLTRDWSRLVIDFDIGYGSDLDLAMNCLRRVFETYATEHASDVLEPPEILGVQNLAESSIQIRAQVKVLPGKQWAAGRDLRARAKKALDASGIEIPFPQRTVWLRQEKTP